MGVGNLGTWLYFHIHLNYKSRLYSPRRHYPRISLDPVQRHLRGTNTIPLIPNVSESQLVIYICTLPTYHPPFARGNQRTWSEPSHLSPNITEIKRSSGLQNQSELLGRKSAGFKLSDTLFLFFRNHGVSFSF